ncbi:MAG: hypothetical protein C7B45_12800 [Sulfobacillus acidophilus]|uniref:Uncharacterized protein n=1 Tax=Sulfobacillus acidophilus TaxID=53633 RepID=A0A2T2WFB8_9FIRM|nr:MAG: hypothetical protein C7B45_12800 [Sulfobacillus acidophilus]
MKDFQDLWKRAAIMALVLGAMFAMSAGISGSRILWGLAAGIIPGEIDLVGLGLRLPLWARLNPRAAVTGVNLRLLSRLVVLGIYFYVLKRYTDVSVYAALIGVFLPHLVYLVWAAVHSKGKGVNG